MRQMGFGFLKDYKKEFGGELLIGKRKSKRPLSTKNPIHLVLRADLKGVFNPTNRSLQKLIQSTAQEFQIKIYDFAINWNHIHLVIKLKQREDYTKFIRALTSKLSLKVSRMMKEKFSRSNKLPMENSTSSINLKIKISVRNDEQIDRKASEGQVLEQQNLVVLPKLFTLRPFTRILSWGRDFKNALDYQILNQMEARGLISRYKKEPNQRHNKQGVKSKQ
jgi:REP element-mobilizing transposase RayT